MQKFLSPANILLPKKDFEKWAVSVEWDLDKDYLTFYKGYGRDRKEITLRIGPNSYEAPTKKKII